MRGNDYIPLAQAYLCADCNAVGNHSLACPACASQNIMGLAGVLDRQEKKIPFISLAPMVQSCCNN